MQRDKTDAPFLAGGAEGEFPASPFPFVIVDKDLFRTGEVGNVQCALLFGKISSPFTRICASPAIHQGMRIWRVISTAFAVSIFRQGTRQSGWEGYLRVSSSTDCFSEEVLARWELPVSGSCFCSRVTGISFMLKVTWLSRYWQT